MKLKRFLMTALVLSTILCAFFVTVSAADIVDSGECGTLSDTVYWTLDSDGVLNIYGSGSIASYSPWDDYRKEIKKVVIESGVTSIGQYAFSNFINLTEVELSDHIGSILEGAFCGCTSLKEIKLPKNLRYIYRDAFMRCTALESIAFPDVHSIGEGAFAECISLCRIDFGISYPAIKDNAFYSVTATCYYPGIPYFYNNLVSCNFGGKLTWVEKDIMAQGVCGDNITWTLSSAGTLTLTGTGGMWDYEWGDCTGEEDRAPWHGDRLHIKRIVVGEGITKIGSSAFCNCNGVLSVSLPESLKTIGNSAFYDCISLEKLVIPAGVTTIKDMAFYDCCSLQAVVFKGSKPAIEARAFLRIGTNVYYPDDGTWTADVMKDYGGKLTWIAKTDPVITVQPQTTYTKMGHTAQVKVTATGNALSYQWYYKNVGDTEFSKSSNQKDTYKPVMSEAAKDRSVYCVVTDAFGQSVKSDTVYLRLAATVTEQPADAKVMKGEKATVALTAAGDGLTYTWYHASAGSSNFTKTDTFTGNTYSVEMNESRNGRRVYCVVTDKYGNSDQSEVATISMAQLPVITAQPKTTYTKQGATVKVTVAAEGEGLTYQWYIKNAGTSKYSKSSVTSATYTTTMSSASKDRLIYCVVTNQYGASVKSETARLRMAATITAQPTSVAVSMGDTAKVTVKAVGDGLTYKWYYKDAGSNSFKLTTTFTGNTYSVEMNKTRAGRQVYCVVKDQYGKTAKSDVATLGLPLEITKQPTTGYAANGNQVRVSVKAAGNGLSYQWYVRNADSDTYSKSSVTGATYSATMNSMSKDRRVYCVITDQYGNTVQTKTVILRMTASVASQPQSTIASNGAMVSVSIQAMGDGLTYQWYIKNAGGSGFSKSSVTSATYSCTMSSKVDGRQVYCVITDKYGYSVKTNIATLTME